MKALLVICMLVVATFGGAAGTAAPATPAGTVSGVVLEVQEAGSFTYLRLKTKDGETWAAVGKAPVNKGATVTIENAMFLTDFESKALKRKFDRIVLGSLAGAGTTGQTPGPDKAATHAGVGKTADTSDIRVPKASGADARTVAEIVTKRGDLKGKPVVVRGKVVKYNPGIMGKNWIHLRDGSGSAADGTNDLLVTSVSEVKLGDVVTMKGIVRTDQDFGSGYRYPVVVENAARQP